jgi:hypothetical protein
VDKVIKGLEENDLHKKMVISGFLLEICNCSKQLQTDLKKEFFEKFLDSNLIEQLITIMVETHHGEELHDNFKVSKASLLKINAGEILSNCFQVLPGRLKQYFLSEKQKKNDYNVLSLLLNLLKYSPMPGLKYCLAEFYKTLLEPDTKELKNEFVDVFFDKLAIKLTDSLTHTVPKNKLLAETLGLSQHLILDILMHSIKSHPNKAINYIISTKLLTTLEPLYTSPLKYIRLGMLKLLRTIIATKEDTVVKHIIDNQLLKPLFNMAKNIKKDNLLHSAMLSLFMLICVEDMKVLVEVIAKEELKLGNDKLAGLLQEKIEKNERLLGKREYKTKQDFSSATVL